MNKSWKVAYYISTVLFSVTMLIGGFYDLTQHPYAAETMKHLGYPLYAASIIGAAKLLGIVGLWQKKVPALREWAYAGFTIDLIGAIASHLAVGDGLGLSMPAIIHLVVLAISYTAFRKLGYRVPAKHA